MKRTKKAAALLFAALLPCLGAPVFAEGETQEAVPLTGEKIYVYNWGEYIADGKDGSLDINTEFTRRTGIEVDYSTFDTNESVSYTHLTPSPMVLLSSHRAATMPASLPVIRTAAWSA